MPEGNALHDAHEVQIRFSGGLADSGEVDLEDYRISLEGWQGLIELASRVYFFGYRATPSGRGRSPFSLHVRAPERGSVVTEILLKLQDPVLWAQAIAMGLTVNATWDAIKSQTPKFVKWFCLLSRQHVQSRRAGLNMDALVENLRRLVESPELPANQLPLIEDFPDPPGPELFVEPTAGLPDADESDEAAPADLRGEWLKRVIDSVDISLEEASRPISGGCKLIELFDTRSQSPTPLFKIDVEDRESLLKPISSLGDEIDWTNARIRFRRIDRESGSVIFRFEDRPTDRGNHYGYIADKSYLRPHNPYTQALDGVSSLSVWVRHETTENGGKRYAFRSSRPQKQLTLM